MQRLSRFPIKSIAWIIGLVAVCSFIWFLPTSIASAQTSTALDLGLSAAEETGLGSADIRVTIARIIRAALGLLGIAALLLVLYGGFTYMTAGGNEEKVAQAKKILLNAGVGMIIIFSSFGIVSFVLNSLVSATTGSETGLGGDGTGGGDDGGGSGSFSQSLYVVSLPQSGAVCIRNIKPQIVFNKEVDLVTVQSAIQVKNKATNIPVAGVWGPGLNKNTINFLPAGSCAPSAGDDCLEANTEYVIEFVNPTQIKTLNKTPEQTLNCRLRAGCRTVTLTTGEGVDRVAPTITIDYPKSGAPLEAGQLVKVKLTYNDDNGVQNVALYHDGLTQSSQSFAGCKKTDTVTLDWTVGSKLTGDQVIEARATDWSGAEGSDQETVTIKPAHCYNGILDTSLGETQLGPPECGGACGACGGGTCTANSDCASGTCTNGVCVNALKIQGFSPASGAKGTLVTINGLYFGTSVGKVYFSNKERPSVTNAADWVEAPLASCGTAGQSWSSTQILAEVPEGAANYSHIKVESAPQAGKTSVDATSNHAEIAPFELNSLIRPKICALDPLRGKSGDAITLFGERFGEWTSAADRIMFGTLQAGPVLGTNNIPSWVDNRIVAQVPQLIGEGNVGVKIQKNGVESNSVRFYVEPGVQADSPIISAVAPNEGAEGEYITIEGTNFGDQLGDVWFKANATGPAIAGDFSFPRECGVSFWSNTKVIVKFPKGKGVVGTKYFVQINTSKNKVSPIDQGKFFTLKGGNPKPGICKITPASGPIPFPTGQNVEIFGEYFTAGTGSKANVYFWGTNASAADDISNRPFVENDKLVSITANKIVVVPPAGSISGPVSVYRTTDTRISNGVPFNVFDCRSEGAKCSANQHCCMNGDAAGVCKPNGELCVGEVLTAGYVWRFATKDIPPVPHVVERCDAVTESGRALPSPAPSTLWGANEGDVPSQVCKNAVVTVEFTSLLDQTTVKPGNVVVRSCSSITNGTCADAQPVTLTSESLNLKMAAGEQTSARHYLEIQPTQTWEAGKWYQVVFDKKVTSLASSGQTPIALAADRPCGGNSAYCFEFKASANECQLRSVMVTPYNYVTKALESPIARHIGDDSIPVDYRGVGLSDQRCVVMDTKNLAWKWSTSNREYATIFGAGNAQKENVNALANTVAIGLSNDSVEVSAAASVETSQGIVTKTGVSPLTIDLSNPQVIDNWPKCQEACTNAEVAVRFNVSMSTRNLLNGGVKMFECKDENCRSTEQVGNASDFVLTTESSGTVLKIANGTTNAPELKPNTLYQVVISATSTDPLSSESVLWSRAKSSDPTSFGKPMNNEFKWRFKTKAQRCVIDRAEVLPKNFIARIVNDKSVYTVQPYSSPDSCSPQGQKLNAWNVAWNWTANDVGGAAGQNLVAKIDTFTTRGSNAFCTSKCIRKGSNVPASGVAVKTPICGNGKVEAGEDCDSPDKTKGCSLDCRWLGKSNISTCGNGVVEQGEACDPANEETKAGCTATCLHAGSEQRAGSNLTDASICGFGATPGAGEDCDIGISADPTNPKSAYNCSARCLHTGTRLSSSWCFENGKAGRGLAGFDNDSFKAACARAYSMCGDGITDPDEDPGCDLGNGQYAKECNAVCLRADKTGTNAECAVGKEGCDANGQNVGSSLLYTVPSVCGDGVTGIGEDAFCEDISNMTLTRNGLLDPWVLATAVGRGPVQGNPPKQESTITAAAGSSATSVKGSASFAITCGYRSDEECASVMGSDQYGVGKDTCCYVRSKLLSTYPNNGATNVCRNTSISAYYSSVIDQASLSGSVVLARGTTGACPAGSYELTGVTGAPANYSKWCAGLDTIGVEVAKDALNTSTSHLNFRISEPLAGNTTYIAVIRKNVKDVQGVSTGVRDVVWSFSTTANICEVKSVSVNPSSVYFAKANDTSALEAEARTEGAAKLQPVNGYKWKYIWKPVTSAFVSLQTYTGDQDTTKNTLTSKNANGELDVRATAVLTENKYSNASGTAAFGTSHVVVSLCENPWPPKDLVKGTQRLVIFPYEDKSGNNDGFDIVNKTFTGNPIPGSTVSTDGFFNFSTHYCADNGASGTFDDLPYLQPAVQVSAADLRSNVGTCEVTGDSCRVNSDCGVSYSGTANFVGPVGVNNVCGGIDTDGEQHYFLDSTGDPVACSVQADCTRSDFISWKNGKNYTADCLGVPSQKKELRCFKSDALKRFIFTNSNNTDAIGVQIFTNPQHLTAEQWYQQDKTRGGQGFIGNLQKIKVAGYDAVSDGNNLYIDALNWSGNKLYSNIYLFSINSNAKQDTRKVFNQLISNLRLNTNIPYNEGYCGATIDSPDFEKSCATDLDCDSGQVCATQVEKLKRNYQRLRDLKTIDIQLSNYAQKNNGKFPNIASGSFLAGQSLSVWDWAGLANTLGVSLPKDPVNKLGAAGTCKTNVGTFCDKNNPCPTGDSCVYHNAQNGWSIEDRRFSFACAPNSLAYRYKFYAPNDYRLLVRFEDPKLRIDNATEFFNAFSYSNSERIGGSFGGSYELSSICETEKEVTTINAGTCGDGQVNLNKGEECDPAGAQNIDRSACRADGSGDMIVRTCTSQCKWGTQTVLSCKDNAKCGNGKIDSGEMCDDGANNGKWNKCNAQCSGLVAKGPEGPGFCGDRVLQTANEVCDAGRTTRSCEFKTTCSTSQVCEDVQVCPNKVCKAGTYVSTSACSDTSNCQGFYSGQEQIMQPWFRSAYTSDVTMYSSYITVKQISGAATMNNIRVNSTSRCYVGPNKPYTCRIEFNYDVFGGTTCSNSTIYGTAAATVEYDPAVNCDGKKCTVRITNVMNSSRTGGCMGGSNIPSTTNISIEFVNNNDVRCELPAGATCTTDRRCSDVETCSTVQECSDVPTLVNEPTYGIAKQQSCAWDCQNYGPYCGDGIIQKQYGEECDGGQTCSLSGISGSKSCSATCKFEDKAATAWWKLEKPSADGRNFADATGASSATCTSLTCPLFVPNGGVSATGSFRFNGSNNYISVPVTTENPDVLNPTNAFSVEAWVKPESYNTQYQRILEKGGYSGGGTIVSNLNVSGGYGLEFNHPTEEAQHSVAFVMWDSTGTREKHLKVASKDIPLSVWSHIVGTYEWSGGVSVLKLYVNGQLVSTTVKATAVSQATPTNQKLYIGARGRETGALRTVNDYFNGELNHIKIYKRVLLVDEVKDRYDNRWSCVIPPRSSAAPVAAGPRCGDGIVQSDEFCDLGVKNGVPCPAGSTSCQYCSADCKRSNDIQATQFCGNGVIEGAEVCEVDPNTGVIYAQFSDATMTLAGKTADHNGYEVRTCEAEPGSNVRLFKKGTRVCSTDCRRLFVQETNSSCVACGANSSGAEVKGALVNAIDPQSTDPLYSGSGIANAGFVALHGLPQGGDANISYDYLKDKSDKKIFTLSNYVNGVFAPTKLETNAVCVNNTGRNYSLVLNKHFDTAFKFPVVAQPAPWQYDLVLSPVMATGIRTSDIGAPLATSNGSHIRIITSWVGSSDFSTGIYKPRSSGREAYLENGQGISVKTGWDYFTKATSDIGDFNLWYHGDGSTPNGTKIESYTIDANRMNDDYMIYVVAHGQTMVNVKNGQTRLRVDVYLPENTTVPYTKMSLPYKTFYVNLADSSTVNQSAPIWHVLTIKRTANSMAERITPAAQINPDDGGITLYENGRIVTNRAQMN